MKRFAVSMTFFLFVTLVWEMLVGFGAWSELIVPRPSSVIQWLWSALMDGSLARASWVTMQRLLIGYCIGLAMGLPLGFITAHSRRFQDTVGLVALGFQTLPSVCWIPLALLWFGQTEKAMFFVVIMGSLWSVLLATENGIRSMPPIYVRAARTMGSRGMHTWLKVIFPASLPFMVGGMKQGWAFAWRSLMAAEIYVVVLSGFGLGQMLHYGRELHAMEQVAGVMFVIIVLGLLVDKVFFAPWERFLRRRWGLIA